MSAKQRTASEKQMQQQRQKKMIEMQLRLAHKFGSF